MGRKPTRCWRSRRTCFPASPASGSQLAVVLLRAHVRRRWGAGSGREETGHLAWRGGGCRPRGRNRGSFGLSASEFDGTWRRLFLRGTWFRRPRPVLGDLVLAAPGAFGRSQHQDSADGAPEPSGGASAVRPRGGGPGALSVVLWPASVALAAVAPAESLGARRIERWQGRLVASPSILVAAHRTMAGSWGAAHRDGIRRLLEQRPP